MALTNVAGTLHFRANDGVHGDEPWRSDGTKAGTRLIADMGLAGASGFARYGAEVLFSASGDVGRELYKTDGTPGGTELVKDIYPNVEPEDCWVMRDRIPCGSNPHRLTRFAGHVFFVASDGAGPPRLGRTDGTTGGTTLWQEPCPDIAVRYITVLKGVLYFTCGNQLWKSDGSKAGTGLVKDIGGASGASFNDFTRAGGALWFFANDGVHGGEPWTSDGTSAGTRMVMDVFPGPTGSNPSNFTTSGRNVVFRARHRGEDYELWKSDGTKDGTRQLKDIGPGTQGSAPDELTRVGRTIIFLAQRDGKHWKLWKTDGTRAGTKRIRTGRRGPSSHRDLTKVGREIFFAARGRFKGLELWKTDGTARGTKLVKNIRAGRKSSNPLLLTNVRGTLFFTAEAGRGRELWKHVP